MAFADHPVHKGGQKWQTALAGGTGNLQTDGFNLFARSTSRRSSDAAKDRPFGEDGLLPQTAFNKLSSQASRQTSDEWRIRSIQHVLPAASHRFTPGNRRALPI